MHELVVFTCVAKGIYKSFKSMDASSQGPWIVLEIARQ